MHKKTIFIAFPAQTGYSFPALLMTAFTGCTGFTPINSHARKTKCIYLKLKKATNGSAHSVPRNRKRRSRKASGNTSSTATTRSCVVFYAAKVNLITRINPSCSVQLDNTFASNTMTWLSQAPSDDTAPSSSAPIFIASSKSRSRS